MPSLSKESPPAKVLHGLQFEKDEELPLPKLPSGHRGSSLFRDDDCEKVSLLKSSSLVQETLATSKDTGVQLILQEYDFDTDASVKNPSTNFCLAVLSTFCCAVVGIFAINHAVQAHYYKQVFPHAGGRVEYNLDVLFIIFAGLMSLADAHGSKAASLAVVAFIMGVIIFLWVAIIRMMLLADVAL